MPIKASIWDMPVLLVTILGLSKGSIHVIKHIPYNTKPIPNMLPLTSIPIATGTHTIQEPTIGKIPKKIARIVSKKGWGALNK